MVEPAACSFGLTAQLRRAAASVPTNIAEGAKRQSSRDFAHFLNIAESSLAETEYLLLLAQDLRFPMPGAPFAEMEELAKMLHGLRKRVLEETDP